MPYKSKAQQRKFHAMANRGEISQKTVEHWDNATKNYSKLPEKVADDPIALLAKTVALGDLLKQAESVPAPKAEVVKAATDNPVQGGQNVKDIVASVTRMVQQVKQARDSQQQHAKVKQVFIKIAAQKMRESAVTTFSSYLDKVAYDCPANLQTCFRSVQIALANGKNLGRAMAIGFPKMANDKREKFARQLVKAASGYGAKCGGKCGAKGDKPKVTQSKNFQGKPTEGMDWMKKQSMDKKAYLLETGGALHGALTAPKGHGWEGAGRGLAKGFGADIGAGIGGVGGTLGGGVAGAGVGALADLLGALLSKGKYKGGAGTAVGAGAGMAGGGIGGLIYGGKKGWETAGNMMGKPSWEGKT